MELIKVIFKWLLRKETLSNAIFALNIYKNLFTNKDAKSLSKNRAVLRRVQIAQDGLNAIQGFLPNDETQNYVDGINDSNDKKTWGDFSARLQKDKHGKGNHGIDVGIKTHIGKVPIEFSHDFKDGSSRGKVGPFSFNT